MALTYQDVMTRARRILQDEDSGNYRYPDTDLLDAVNDAMKEVRRLRPDLFINTGYRVPTATAATNNLLIEDHWFMCLVYMSAGQMMLRDDEFSLDSRAVNLLNKGTSQLQTTQA